jgi:hypothetical protein
VFLLQPAETKSRRVGAQAMVPGTAIQDPNDGDISGSVVEYLPNGKTKVTELADYYMLSHRRVANDATCDPQTAVEPCTDETAGGGGAPTDTTFLETVVIPGVCDNGDCNQNNEFEWHTYISHDNGATFTGRVDVLLQLPSEYENIVHIPAVFARPRPNSNDLIQSDVVETDTFSPDDHFGSPRWDPSQNNAMMSEGELRCGHVNPDTGERFDCSSSFTWREVNQSMRWTPF